MYQCVCHWFSEIVHVCGRVAHDEKCATSTTCLTHDGNNCHTL